LVLKGLSHEIDFKKVDKNGQILALIRPWLVFEYFGGSSDFLLKQIISFPVNAKITPNSLCYPINFVTELSASLLHMNISDAAFSKKN
jgi:hypothetical protein